MCVCLQTVWKRLQLSGDTSPELVSLTFSGFGAGFRLNHADDARVTAELISHLLLAPDRRHHGLDAKDVEGPSQIVDERREAELSPDIVEALH